METREAVRSEKRVFLTTDDKRIRSGMGYAELLGYLYRMQDEGLVKEIEGVGDMIHMGAISMFLGDVRGFHRASDLPLGLVFAGKLVASDRLTEDHLKQLKKRFPTLEYDFYEFDPDNQHPGELYEKLEPLR